MAAISTVKITDSMEFCKRLSFNRNFGLGNSLEPALTAANMTMQMILNPPFMWWWNSQEISFTCSTVLPTSAVTNVSLSGNIVTLLTNNSWAVNDQVLVSGLTGAAFLNGAVLTILPGATTTQVTAFFKFATSYPPTADAGTLTKVTTQDYTVNVPNFSHIEHASVYDTFTNSPTTGTTGKKWWELDVEDNLSLDSTLGRPQFINPHFEDTNGNVTFRMMPAPSQNYPVSVHCQLAPPQITSLNQTWSPLPDFMQHIYTWGFMHFFWLFADDPRAAYAGQKFTAGLLGRAEGLSEEDRNIFLNNFHMLTTSQQTKFQQGSQGRMAQ
jgi:hypothetical protein